MFHPDHFRAGIGGGEAAALFKRAVQTVEISISSYCNRRCPYCPNSKADRISKKHLMSDGLFFNVMRHLCKIDYAGGVHINRYNEPLADREYAMKRIGEIRAFLPDAKIVVFTNGDYLDASYVRQLADAGVYSMVVTVHEAPNGTSFPDLLDDQDRLMKRLGLPFTYVTTPDGKVRCADVDTGSAMNFSVWGQDFHRRDENGVLWMQDRGQSLEVEKGMVRSTPCFMPFVQMQIEWDGELLPCCQIQPDVFAKDKYSLGRLTASSDIFVAWTNTKYVQWRKDLFSYEIKKPPCSTCSYGGYARETPANRAQIDEWRRVLALDAVAA
jgi:radical SAM protein with 4Fe4S-binding SPASM domain